MYLLSKKNYYKTATQNLYNKNEDEYKNVAFEGILEEIMPKSWMGFKPGINYERRYAYVWTCTELSCDEHKVFCLYSPSLSWLMHCWSGFELRSLRYKQRLDRQAEWRWMNMHAI